MLGKIEGRRKRGRQRMRWLDGIMDSMDMSLSKLRELVKEREAWHATVYEVTNELDTVQFSSVTQSCLTLCNPMDCSMTDLPVHHQLLEPDQTHVHQVNDAIQPSHPLLSPFLPAFNLSQHQGLL